MKFNIRSDRIKKERKKEREKKTPFAAHAKIGIEIFGIFWARRFMFPGFMIY